NVKAKAKVKGRWHDNRHTLITDRAEGGAGDETIRDTAGHISKQVLKHYSHTGLLAQKCRRVYEFEIQWTAESPRGIAPQGAHRSVLEPLGSHGSCHPPRAAALRHNQSVPSVAS